jgi:hypothetical protein
MSFHAGAIVTLHLIQPSEKFWGVLERLEPVGVVYRGISLDSFEDWINELAGREGSSLGLATMFVPLFRVERIFLDEQVGEVESYRQRLERRTGIAAHTLLGRDRESGGALPS